MTFLDALFEVLSFFWSPLFVTILLIVLIVVGGSLVSVGTDYSNGWMVLGGGVVIAVSAIFAFALTIYLTTEGIDPLGWI